MKLSVEHWSSAAVCTYCCVALHTLIKQLDVNQVLSVLSCKLLLLLVTDDLGIQPCIAIILKNHQNILDHVSNNWIPATNVTKNQQHITW